MRRRGLLIVPLLAAAAMAQEAAKPAPEVMVLPPEFVGNDTIKTADGMVVYFYRVKYVDAQVLLVELKRWMSAKGNATAEGQNSFVASPTMGGRPAAVTTMQNTIRINDTAENLPILLKVLDMVDVAQPQVYVEAKIVEITYDDDLHVGWELHTKNTLGDTFFQTSDLKFPNRLDAVNAFTTTFHGIHKYLTFDYVVDLAASGANTNVMSKPGIFASQGETATIRVGDNEPIVQQTLSGNAVTASTTFRDVGLRLEVQPLLIGRDAVRARISAEASRISEFRVTATSQNLQVVNPVISTRNADTVLTVPDGETVVIGGLDSDLLRDSRVGIPLLKDIPVLGWAFGSTSKRKVHTELVFFLKFSILSPGEARVVTPPSAKEKNGE